MPRYYIDNQKVYDFPKEIVIIEKEGHILIIAPELANWIVLDSMAQLQVFEQFRKGVSIDGVLRTLRFSESDVAKVVTQIEARRFYRKVPVVVPEEVSMHLYLTNRCNLSCPHCYMFSGQPNGMELSTFEIKRLIKDFAELGEGAVLTLSGGEPTLHPDFEEIVHFAFDRGLDIQLMTNGTCLSPSVIDAIAPCLTSVQVSIDGFSEESNARIRGLGHFDKALEVVDDFIQHGVYTAIAMTPSLQNLKEQKGEYIAFAKDLAARYEQAAFEIRFSEELLNGRCIGNASELNTEYGRLMAEIQEAIYGEDFRVQEFVKRLSDSRRLVNCSFGNLAVSAVGDVFLCPRIQDLKAIGNVRICSLEELLAKAKVAEEATRIDRLYPCKDCDLRYICGGGCRMEEFAGLTGRDSFEAINARKHPRRGCDASVKARFYDLMIESNAYFFSELG